MVRVKCPCCKGKTYLVVFDDDGYGEGYRCTHCMGAGTVVAEEQRSVADPCSSRIERLVPRYGRTD